LIDVMAQLGAGLEGRYTIARQIGSGGMATVYLARDLRHHRDVAIKVLRPDLGVMLGAERFLREIEVAASLSHPNILPLLDSGDAEGLLFYVMPFIEGESLADRLVREVQLPIDEALRLTREVAEALAHAHARGVIHRDIKPANILLSSQHAIVADFGIARAIGAAEKHQLTSAGMALGTPAYMSPEQGAGSLRIDGRSDIYSLGCVLFEMLIGEPPYTGPTAQVIVARHASAAIPSLRTARGTVPEQLEWVVEKALAKVPADRFADASAFAQALAAPETGTHRLPRRPGAPSRNPRRVAWTLAALAALAATAVVARRLGPGRAAPAAPSTATVAVLPFHADRAASPAARSAAGALAGLLSERLTGEAGPRAVDAGTVAAAMRRAAGSDTVSMPLDKALRVARTASATELVVGQVAEVGGRLSLSASLIGVPGGAELARVENVTGPPDSLLALADRIVTSLLVRRGAEPTERQTVLEAAPLAAVRAYLAGRQAFGRGTYAAAARLFKRALAQDSALAPAALGLATAGSILGTGDEEDGTARAWAVRDRLGPTDLLYLGALAGPRYPHESSRRDRLKKWEDATAEMPDRFEAWFQFGSQLYTWGGLMGIPGAADRAAAAFRRAVELDSTFIPALGYLVDLAASARDTAALQHLGARYLALDTAGEVADYYRWRIAAARGDSATLRRFRARFDAVPLATLDRVISVAQLDGVALDDALSAAQAMGRRSGLGTETSLVGMKIQEIALNGGRPADAIAAARRFRGSREPTSYERLVGVIQGLYWGGDSAETVTLAMRSIQIAGAMRLTPVDPDAPELSDICAAGLWQVRHGQLAPAAAAVARLRRVRNALDDVLTGWHAICAETIDVELAAARHTADAMHKIQALDTLMRTGPRARTWILAAANLTLARLWEERGNLAAALAATRRRHYTYGPQRALVALSTQLREEGRLSALTGDRAGATKAYRSYLALRGRAEPAREAEVRQVRTELDRLQYTGVAPAGRPR
jgi:serine/threonine-protein kinase